MEDGSFGVRLDSKLTVIMSGNLPGSRNVTPHSKHGVYCTCYIQESSKFLLPSY